MTSLHEKLLQAKEEVKKEMLEKKATAKKPERRRIMNSYIPRKDYCDMTQEEYEKKGYTNEK